LFDENEVLQKAMMVFWQKGYEGASICDLMTATGLTKSSIYKASTARKTCSGKPTTSTRRITSG